MANRKPFATANITTALAAAVANAATVAIPYPAGQTQASLTGSLGGVVVINNNMVYPQAASGAGTVALAFGASTITITNNSGETWPAGASLIASFGAKDYSDSIDDAALETRIAALEAAAP